MFLFSCSNRSLSYFNDYNQEQVLKESILSKAKNPIIQPGDLLEIIVTDLNPVAAAPFNRISSKSSEGTTSESAGSSEGYLVDDNGIIDFPVLGRVKVGGVSKYDAKINLTNLLTNYLGKPNVSIRYLNYRITVVGEVKNPNTFLVPSERISLIEALGMAGDLTIYGKRENVMIINETNSERTIVHLDLNKKETLNSPYFYLQPNDVVYVEPVKTRKDQAGLARSNVALLLSVVTAASLVYLNFK
ncbi:sugar transporter [Kriegella sp. EG-1]|nr:sugar transporter [Flavobacteriaceae bacterium EG-1]